MLERYISIMAVRNGEDVDCIFFFSSRRRHTRFDCDWSSDVCSSDLPDTTDTAPNSPMARALHRITPYTSPQRIFGSVTWKNVIHAPAPRVIAASSSSLRSEERRVGKECRSRWSPYH